MSDLNDHADPVATTLTYRAFRLGWDGRVYSAEIIQAASDDDAKTIAGKMVNGHGIDLWEGPRLIASFPPLSAQAPENL